MDFFVRYYGWKLLYETVAHLEILIVGLPPAILAGVSIGFLLFDRPRLSRAVLAAASVVMTVPGLALFAVLVVVFSPLGLGLGLAPAATAVAVYALLPVLRNTIVALRGVEPGIVDAARGMGLSDPQILFRIRFPLAIPVLMAGVRTSVLLGVGIAAFGFLAAAGGLGTFIFSGIGRGNVMLTGAGTVAICLLGALLNAALLILEKAIAPRGLKEQR